MKAFHILSLLCLLGVESLAQKNNQDTVKTIQLSEIIVTATRSQILAKDSPSPVDVIDLHQIQSVYGNTVADVLQRYTSIFLKEYGASGALKTASVRGTASEHLLVLINGNRVNTLQNGLVDLSLLPLNDVERIEVVRGGNSALFGTEALGGVVNIVTRQPRSEWLPQAEVGAGSFGYQRYFLESQGRLGPVGLLAGYSSERGRDDFPYEFDQSSLPTRTTRRSNSDFHRRQLFVHGDAVTGDNSLITFSAAHVIADRGVPGDVRFSSDVARQNDKDVNLLLACFDNHLRRVEFTLRGGFHYNFETYADPTFLIDSYYKNIFFNLNPQVQLRVGKVYRLILGGELAQGTLHGNDFDGKISRIQRSFYLSNELQFESDRTTLDRIAFYQTVRYDHFSDVDNAVTPKFGINLRVLKECDVRIRLSIGRNFRIPSFNDLYYRGFSNPNLKPEHSTNFDVGALASVSLLGEQRIEVTYFELKTNNRILFDLSTYLPVNIGKTESTGLELIYQGGFFDRKIDLTLNYTLSDSRKINRDTEEDPSFNKQLLYLPKDVVNITLMAHLDPFEISLAHSFVGRRYTREDNSQWLPPYHLTHANMLLSIPIGLQKLFLRGEVNNIFDRGYQVFPFYPMPKRNYRIALGLAY